MSIGIMSIADHIVSVNYFYTVDLLNVGIKKGKPRLRQNSNLQTERVD